MRKGGATAFVCQYGTQRQNRKTWIGFSQEPINTNPE